MKVVVAGSTGYLGAYLVSNLMKSGIEFQAIARNPSKLIKNGLPEDQIIKAEVTDPDSLKGIFNDVDIVISAVGITRQKEGLTYMDVDYQANLNLLNEAMNAGVRKFVYISAINGDKMRHLKIMEAKEKFVDMLKASGLEYQIIRPNGFFSDMTDFLDMAKKGKVYLFGHGEFKLNPIHGDDLAKFILESLALSSGEMTIGGPDILTQNEIAQLSLKALNKPVRVIHLPDWIRRLMIYAMRKLTPVRVYGPFEFFLTMMGQDNVAPRCGVHRLRTYFSIQADQILTSN